MWINDQIIIINVSLIVKFGVSQGTILVPMLFWNYTKDLFELNLNGKTLAYADDTALFFNAKNNFDLEFLVKCNFIKIRSWFIANLLSCNINKIVIMTFALSKVSIPRIKTLENYSSTCLENRNCNFNCFKLKRNVDNVKYLGIYFNIGTK